MKKAAKLFGVIRPSAYAERNGFKHHLRWCGVIALAAIIVLGIAGCREEGINYGWQTYVPIQQVTLDHDDITLTVGDTATLTATIYPPNATNKYIDWTTSDGGEVAMFYYGNGSVDNLTITFIANRRGTSTITATAYDGDKTVICNCNITVEAVRIDRYPVPDDFYIENLIQTFGNVTPVRIRPIYDYYELITITTYYDGSTTLPTEAGTYTVTFDVTAASIGYYEINDWHEACGLYAGILEINGINARAPQITTQPVDATVSYNTSRSMHVNASGSGGGTLSYQWYSNTSASNIGGTVITGAASSSYYPPTGTPGTYYYFVEVTNTIPDNGDGGNKSASVRSDAAIFTVIENINAQTPSITSQPASATVLVNALHNLSVEASVSDSGILSYQWYSNTSASNSGGTIITGATSASYNPPTDIIWTYYYYVIVTNTIPNNGDGGTKTASVSSDAVALWVNVQINAQTPTITTHPVSATVIYNASRYLYVNASRNDGGTLSYQWYSNTSASNIGGTVITGAASSSYYPPTGTPGTYYYFVEVTNTMPDNGDGGIKTASVRSNVATFTVEGQGNAALTITFSQIIDYAPSITGPTLYRVSNGGPTSETLTVENPEQYDSISWQVQNTSVTGTGASFTLTPANAAYNLIGEHLVTVVVMKDGMPYNKTVSFRIEY